MATMIVSFCVFFAAFFAANKGAHLPIAWSAAIAVLFLMASQASAFLLVRRATNKVNANLQELMQEIQKRLMRKQQMYVRKPVAQKLMMQQMQKEQNAGLEEVLKACDQFQPIYKWNLMLKRQVNTMKMVFYFQMKNYEEADKLMPHCLFMDPQSVCVKIARMYQLKQDGIEKFFNKKCRKLKNDDCVLPYSLYTWILLKQGKNDEAFKVITEAKGKTSNEVVLKNWEFLANGKFKQFSNAGIGDLWYMLALEEPRMPKVQQQFAHAR